MLNEKVAIVTGAISGICLEIAREFAARGARVIVCSSSSASARKASSLIVKGRAYPEQLNVTEPNDVAHFVRRVRGRHNHIDILVNNAGDIASNDFSFTTGNTIVIDGGTVLL